VSCWRGKVERVKRGGWGEERRTKSVKDLSTTPTRGRYSFRKEEKEKKKKTKIVAKGRLPTLAEKRKGKKKDSFNRWEEDILGDMDGGGGCSLGERLRRPGQNPTWKGISVPLSEADCISGWEKEKKFLEEEKRGGKRNEDRTLCVGQTFCSHDTPKEKKSFSPFHLEKREKKKGRL